MNRFISRTTSFLTIVGVALVLGGCRPKPGGAAENTTRLPVARVRVETVKNKSRTMTEEVAGTVRAKLRATLEARLSARIETIPVTLGARVRKGQMIARLDAGEIAARLKQAEASGDEAERNWQRASALFEQQGATRAEYDFAQARQRIAQGAVAEAKAMMDSVEIAAPFDGVVTKKWAEVGDLAAPGKPLVEIEDPSALQLEADVPEAMAPRIERDSRLGIHVDALSNELTGVVSEIAPGGDPASRTFRVKLDMPPTVGLRPGQFARLAVPIGERRSVRVPVAAVVSRGQLEMVFSVADQRAQMHLVKTGRRTGDEVEILSGLEAGTRVVISEADQLTDGQPVEVR